MYESLPVRQYRVKRPSMFHTLTEAPRALMELGYLVTSLPTLSLARRGDRHPLLLIPGFMAGDTSLALLKRYLRGLGYQPETWGFGRNLGKPEHLFDHLPERLMEMADRAGEPVSLIGQSLGGVFARELAREFPEITRQVITMGSPFGMQNDAFTLKALTKLYRVSSGRSIREMVELMREREAHISPDVPMTAIYSRGDGVVHWGACREAEENHHTQNIEVLGSHCGMGFNAMIYYIISDRLAQSVDQWKKFKMLPDFTGGCILRN